MYNTYSSEKRALFVFGGRLIFIRPIYSERENLSLDASVLLFRMCVLAISFSFFAALLPFITHALCTHRAG